MKASEQAEEMLLRVQGIEQQNEDLKTELATLRAQLAGKWVLGEPLTYEEWDALPSDHPIFEYYGNYLVASTAGRLDWKATVAQGGSVYLDPRPQPTLPQPEVPAVPPLMERIAIARCSSCQCNVKSPEWSKHDPQCRYRVLCEAEELLAALHESEATE